MRTLGLCRQIAACGHGQCRRRTEFETGLGAVVGWGLRVSEREREEEVGDVLGGISLCDSPVKPTAFTKVCALLTGLGRKIAMNAE